MNLKDIEYLQPKTILDIGANCGHWALQAKEVWKDAHIIMIEANEECIGELTKTGLPFRIALLGKERKIGTFFQRKVGGTSTGDSLYRENTDWYSDQNVLITEREIVPLDELFNFQDSNGFEMTKIDCQGGELDILKGGKKFFEKCKYIIMEVPVPNIVYNIGAPTAEEVAEYMLSIRFQPEKVLEDIVHPIGRHLIQQDVLFTRI